MAAAKTRGTGYPPNTQVSCPKHTGIVPQTHRYRAPLQTMRIKEPKRGEEHRTCLGSPQPMSICIGLYKVEGLDHGFHAKKQVLRLEQQPVL